MALLDNLWTCSVLGIIDDDTDTDAAIMVALFVGFLTSPTSSPAEM